MRGGNVSRYTISDKGFHNLNSFDVVSPFSVEIRDEERDLERPDETFVPVTNCDNFSFILLQQS